MPKQKADTKTKTRKADKEMTLTRLVEEIVDQGATTAEEINRAVLELPISVLENLGLEETAKDVKKIQDKSIGAIYKLIHDINHQVAELATDILKPDSAKPKKKPR
jgi:hypothetical protein